jgi:hypothetical protein
MEPIRRGLGLAAEAKACANRGAVLLNALREDDRDDFGLGLHVFQGGELLDNQFDDVAEFVGGVRRADGLLKIAEWNLALNVCVSLEATSKGASGPWKRREAERVERFAFGIEAGGDGVLDGIEESFEGVDAITGSDHAYGDGVGRRENWPIEFQAFFWVGRKPVVAE